MKICNNCNIKKEFSQFHKSSSGKYGYHSHCRDCRKIYRTKNNKRIVNNKKIYYINNKDKILNKQHEYYNSHKDERLEYAKKWYETTDKIELNQRKAKYQRNKIKNDPEYKLKCLLRTRLVNAINNQFICGSFVRDLGCSIVELKTYIESKFQPGMTWENWSKTGWHLDHIQPLSSFDLLNREEFLKACNYTNLQPLWAKDNLKKGKKWTKN